MIPNVVEGGLQLPKVEMDGPIAEESKLLRNNRDGSREIKESGNM
jgi:hypothetical protein